MADAITELRKLRDWISEDTENDARHTPWIEAAIDRRIAELEAAQQAEPSDAEVEAWHGRMNEVMMSLHRGWGEAIAIMLRGRGDQRLREAAAAFLKIRDEVARDSTVEGQVAKRKAEAALRAALGGAP